jgi:hypothetical protein
VAATPQRRVSDHYHPDAWTKTDQHRYEDQTDSELKQIREELAKLRGQITLMLGAIGLVVFLLPVIAPFIRSLLNIGP